MSDDQDIRRKRIKFRSWHRGTKEVDLILGSFADTHLEVFDSEQLSQLEAILDLPDNDLFQWIAGQTPLPDHLRTPVMDMLLKFDYAKHRT